MGFQEMFMDKMKGHFKEGIINHKTINKENHLLHLIKGQNFPKK
jgi:hypothetical protein